MDGDRRCRDCAHIAPWPERVEFVRSLMAKIPRGYPTHACMAKPCNVIAVSPDDSPASCEPPKCVDFQRGGRPVYVSEVNDAD